MRNRILARPHQGYKISEVELSKRYSSLGAHVPTADVSYAGLAHDIEHAAAVGATSVSTKSVPAAELPSLIATVHGALANLQNGTPVAASAPEAQLPSTAQVRTSVA